jgi:uncharacterized protein (TIGR03437 family)
VYFVTLAGCAYSFDGSVHPFNPGAHAPPVRRTGNPADDNGLTCLACHAGAPLNSGPGRVTIRAAPYAPGVKQIVEVDLRDSNASKWGFQLTARLASDPARQAGSFTPDDDTRVRCGPAGADYAPCNGEQEFASHSLNATAPSVRGGKTFRVEWTPPATDVGDILLYAAGNAANNNIANTGDFVYASSHRIPSSACSLTGTPAIASGGIANAADLRTVIGPNSLISVFGSAFAPPGSRRLITPNDLLGDRVPTELGCVALEIDGRRAPLMYVDGGQINGQVPTAANEGLLPVRVILNPGRPNEIRSNPVMVQVDRYSPAFFTFNGRSIAALNATADNRILADSSVVQGGVAAKPGDVVVLYGTGFGFTVPVYQAGEFSAVPLRDAISITVGGTTLSAPDVLYAGSSLDAPGAYQFNVRVPVSTPDGDVPVSIRIGSASTQAAATIPVRR